MRAKHFVLGTAGAVVLGAMGLSAQAAPVGGAANDLKASAANALGLEQAAFRRCWWRHGERYCRWVGDGYGDYDYGGPSYDYGYGYGPGYYGYGGPGIGLYFGGGGWGHHHHHHR